MRDATSSRHVEQTVLVVDPDRLSSTLVSRMLERAGYAVEVVDTGVAALELLGGRQIAMLIAETQLPDLPLASLVARARQLYATSLPIIALSANIRQPLRLETIRLGIELVSKPVDPEELRARMDAVLRVDVVVPPPATMLSGDLATFSLHDVLTMLDLARFTGVVEVASRREVGTCYLAQGRPYHATFGTRRGLEAFTALVRFAQGWFRVRAGAAAERSIEGSMTQVILNAAVDDAHRRRTPSALALRLDELGVTKHTPTPRSAEAVQLARRLGMALGDAFRLGELELGARGAEPRDGSVIELAMFGELADLVTAMWEVSAPLGPAALFAIGRAGTVPTWRFAGRHADRLVVRMIAHDEPVSSWGSSPVDAVIVLAADEARALDPAVRPFVQREATPVLIVGEARHASMFSPAPFNTIRCTGKSRHELAGQTRQILGKALSLVSDDA